MTHKNVYDVINHRYRTGSTPGRRSDNFKLALCIEGGGMRGVVTAGAVAALEKLNLVHTFDVVYGASAGAYNGAYLLSGNTVEGSRLYLDYANNHQFINFWRFIRGGLLFDLNYVQGLMQQSVPINWQSVITASPPLHIVATDVDKTSTKILKNFKTKSELFDALQASSYIPSIARPSAFSWHRYKYLDAGLLDPFAINAAVREKCTHILVIFSQPWRHRRSLKIIDKKLVWPTLNKISEHLASLYLHHNEYSVNGLSHVWNHYDGTHILTIAPKRHFGMPNQLTTSRQRLARGFLAGLEAVLKELDFKKQTDYILNSIHSELKI